MWERRDSPTSVDTKATTATGGFCVIVVDRRSLNGDYLKTTKHRSSSAVFCYPQEDGKR